MMTAGNPEGIQSRPASGNILLDEGDLVNGFFGLGSRPALCRVERSLRNSVTQDTRHKTRDAVMDRTNAEWGKGERRGHR